MISEKQLQLQPVKGCKAISKQYKVQRSSFFLGGGVSVSLLQGKTVKRNTERFPGEHHLCQKNNMDDGWKADVSEQMIRFLEQCYGQIRPQWSH